MRETSLLEFDDPHLGWHDAQDCSFRDVFKQLILLQLEHPGNQVRAVLDTGPIECFGDFVPVRIAGHGYEEVWFVIFPADSHAVLELGIVPARTANVGAGENFLTNLWLVIIGVHTVCHRSK